MSPSKRQWVEARMKVDLEGSCRVCGAADRSWTPLEAAHIIPRSRVAPGPGEDARNIWPACRHDHARYDAHELDLLPFLTREEQAYAVGLVGLEEAYRRLTGSRKSAPEQVEFEAQRKEAPERRNATGAKHQEGSS